MIRNRRNGIYEIDVPKVDWPYMGYARKIVHDELLYSDRPAFEDIAIVFILRDSVRHWETLGQAQMAWRMPSDYLPCEACIESETDCECLGVWIDEVIHDLEERLRRYGQRLRAEQGGRSAVA